MKKRGGRFVIIIGAGLAVMAFAVVYFATSKGIGSTEASAQPTTAAAMKTIAVVNADVPAYTILDAGNVVTMDVEASTVLSGTTGSPTNVFGQMTLMPLTKGQAILTNQLTASGFSHVIEKGKRAFTLAVSERSTFGGSLTENDYVDLLWTQRFETTQFVPNAEGKSTEKTSVLPTTKTLLENIQVMRVIDLKPPPASNGQNSGQDDQAEPASTKRTTASAPSAYAVDAPPQAVLILAVTDQQAEVIKFANENGIIDMALRSSAPVKGPDGKVLKGPDNKDIIGDHDLEKTTGITTKVLVEQYGLLLPEILIK